MSKKNPLVFLDVSIDGNPVEKMVFELFSDVVPKTAENFRALCTGEKGVSVKNGMPLHYKGSFFHRIIKGSMAEGGDLLRRDGNFGESIYGDKFPDEPPKLKHNTPGLLSMSIAERDARGSLFIITFKANHQLDRKYLVFGKLVRGDEVLKKIENVGEEDGKPVVTVKIINCGEFREGENQSKKRANKLKMGKDASSEANSHEVRRRGKHKRPIRDRRKKRRKYYTSESDSSSDTEMESSESDSDSDSYISSSSELSSSSDDRRKKRKRSSKRDRYRRGKRRDRRREKKRKRRDRRSKHRSKRASDSLTDTESESKSGSSSDDNDVDIGRADRKHKNPAQITVEKQPPLAEERETAVHHKKGEVTETLEREEGEYPKENGERQSNGFEAETKSDRSADGPDVVDDHPGKSRSRSISPKRAMSKSMSISPKKSLSKSPSVSPRRSVSRSPSSSASPPHISQRSRSISRSPARSGSSGNPSRSVSRSPVKAKRFKSVSSSPARIVSSRSLSSSSASRSPVRGKKGTSRSPLRARSRRSISRSPIASPPQRSLSRTPPKISSRKSSRKSVSRSPIRVPRSRTPVRSSRRSISRSSGKAPSRRSFSRSPVRASTRYDRRSYSRSPVSARRRARSPIPDRGRSLSRSPSPDGSPKRVRRGRGFSQRYSYARRYKSPSPDRYRYGGRSDRDRYSSYRRSPRRYRSPPRVQRPEKQESEPYFITKSNPQP
ncbi:peptidyl-prolyl cis-trans isomerase CYP95-like isoform X3 [Cornus florida]|uniref:peptidyl-prolyl cis-trans isomerase CYP95-like isoform X3 n=1 Tax=Cornus florida TaxID=4283 RepID=UPI0028A0668B|nr:peptidyl-prolyl cis-trans isomerase CYP95-like isoform X3 [Cornus florida]